MISLTRTLFRMIVLLALLSLGSTLHAAGTAANTTISNTVTVDYVLDGVPGSAGDSSSVVVEEVLDVSVTWQDAANVAVLSPSSERVLQFQLTNLGNGSEQFILSVDDTVGGDDFDPVSGTVEIWIDNGDGNFSPVDDTLYNGSNGPVLDGSNADDESIDLYLVADMPAGFNESDRAGVALTAFSTTADTAGEVGNPGAEIPGAGAGDGGVRANVGAGGATASATGVYEVGASGVSIDKSVEVIDSDGEANPYTGATLRYTLQVNVDGTVDIDNLVITDPVPDGTTYTPGSIRLDGAVQTDADDAPAMDFSDFDVSNANAITVDLSQGGSATITPPATFTIIFEVTID